jgi:tRNA 5-methylaminomethyl-2-thiouridine biosynthesis bifunctional protein
MPGAWDNQDSWKVLDIDFQNGHHLLNTWLMWQRDPQRSRMLHYVGIAPVAPDAAQFASWQASSDLPLGWEALFAQCKDLGPGFHRFLVDGSRFSLTLCIGDVKTLLGEHVFQADTVFVYAPDDKWAAQTLARRCKRGTRFSLHITASTQVDTAMALMQAAGFQFDAHLVDQWCVTGTFDPHWNIPTSRTAQRHAVPRPARCAVVGAGIAGASVAHALALRGWDVTVFDTAPLPADGASGLPVGLAVPHVSSDDNPRARLSRSGCWLLAQHAQRLLTQGHDWDPCGVLENRPDGSTLWHATACWVKPAKLVQAWLKQPGVRFVGNRAIVELQHANGLWQLRSDQAEDFDQFEVVVLANANCCAELLGNLPHNVPLGRSTQQALADIQQVHGTLSYGSHTQTIHGLPRTPVNGYGCFIPHVPGVDAEQWFAGSTFETDAILAADSLAQHTLNMARLRHLLPTAGLDWESLLNRGQVGQWTSTRCVTHDRLPLVGPVDTGASTGLWLCIGMGSRGLSFSPLCAELLAARLGDEPLPMEFSLSRSLDVNRVRRRTTAKNDG